MKVIVMKVEMISCIAIILILIARTNVRTWNFIETHDSYKKLRQKILLILL